MTTERQNEIELENIEQELERYTKTRRLLIIAEDKIPGKAARRNKKLFKYMRLAREEIEERMLAARKRAEVLDPNTEDDDDDS